MPNGRLENTPPIGLTGTGLPSNTQTTASKGLSNIKNTLNYFKLPTTPVTNKPNKQNDDNNGGKPDTSYTPQYTGGSGGDTGATSTDYGQYLADYYSALKNTIEKQRQEQERLANAKYEQLVKQANDNYNSSINNITKNNAYTNRWLNQNYGGTSGQGLSNKLRANTNYENNLYSAKQDLNSALLNAQTDKYNSQAEATNNYLSNYNNYLTSPLSSMLSNVSAAAIDDGSYKKYLNKLWG